MTTRRQFLQQSAVLSAAAFIDPTELFKKNKGLGIQLYTVRSEVTKDLANSLAQIANAGYSNVELFGYNNRNFFGKSVAEMAALLKQYNLKSPSGHYMLQDFMFNETYNWDSWKYLVEDSKTLGHKYIVIPWIPEPQRTTDNIKRIADRLNKGAEIAKDAGMCAAYHNHDFEFKKMEGDMTGLDYLLKNTDPKHVKFELDIYWVVFAGLNPIDLFNKYPGRFTMWHVKDMEAGQNGAKGQSCEVGKGIINWKEIYAARKTSGLEIPYVEQEAYRHPVFECIKTSADYMKANKLI